MNETHSPVLETHLPLPNRRAGKVRDVYDAVMHDGRDAVLLVATDRLSAFDVVMPQGVPGKGRVLTRISVLWFDMIGRELGETVPHHLLSADADDIAGIPGAERERLRGRVMLGRRTRVVPIECVVRGYLAGSGWKQYLQNGKVCGVALPPGLRQCDKLPHPIFTPATKAPSGHDENITFAQACDAVGERLMEKLRTMSLAVYAMAHDHAAGRGLILADTKFEFGFPLDRAGRPGDQPILIDEVLTPDSSRFWPADQYQPGRDQPSFDKQFVRNHLQRLADAGRWNKQPPGPMLPEEVIRQTAAKYDEAYDLLTRDPGA